MEAPIISIIMPAYNCERFLADTLDSIVEQTVTNWECIIVDDGSRDSTLAVAQSYAARDVRFRVVSQSNSGCCMARNYGYKHACPDTSYLSFMDADDIWLPDALEVLQNKLEACPEAAGACGLADFIDEHGLPLNLGEFADFGRHRVGFDGSRLKTLDTSEPTTFSVLILGNHVFPPGLWLIRREFYNKVGEWDATLNEPGDWDMWLRISRYGVFQFVDKVILKYRRHAANLGASGGTPEACHRLRCKAFAAPENSREHSRIAVGSWRAYQISMVSQRFVQARQHFARRQYKQGIGMIARVPVHCYRYVQGHPTMPK